MATNNDIIEQLLQVNYNLTKLISLWEEKEAKLTQGSRKAITTNAQHSPMTPEQLAYARLGQRNQPETSRM